MSNARSKMLLYPISATVIVNAVQLEFSFSNCSSLQYVILIMIKYSPRGQVYCTIFNYCLKNSINIFILKGFKSFPVL